MTKEITKAYILQQIQDKFKLRELEPEVFSFSETVIPTYDIRPHLAKWEHKFKQVSITSTGAFLFYTVPQDEEWLLGSYNMIFLGAGAIEISGMYTKRTATPTYFVYLDLKKGQTESYLVYLKHPVRLHAGDELHVTCDGYVSTQNFQVYLDVLVEKIR